MRINDIVNLLLPPQPLSRVRPAANTSGDTSGSLARSLIALTDLVSQGVSGGDSGQAADIATTSPAALSKARTSAAPASSDPSVAESTDIQSTGDTSGPDLGGIVESYIRRRAILTYTLPSVGPNGASVSLTFDVEGAQHTTRYFGPSGQAVNAVA